MRGTQRKNRPRQDTRYGYSLARSVLIRILRQVCVFHQGAGVEHDANKATAGGQKEGAKGSLAAAKVKLQLLLKPKTCIVLLCLQRLI